MPEHDPDGPDPDPDDLELRSPPDETSVDEADDVWLPEPQRPRTGVWILGFLVAALLGGGAFWLFRPRPVVTAPPAPLPSAAPRAQEPTATPFPLPPLEGSDATFRELARSLSAHPLYNLFLARTELVRLLAVVVVNVADGESPRPHLPFLAPKAPFGVIEKRSGRLVLDPASYARYDAVADAAASLDAAACTRVFRLLEPLFETAYRELGHPEGGFSRKLDAALGKLLAVPALEGEVPLVRIEKAVVVYEFFDEKLEALTPPQKHLLRMGPKNVKRIQEKLRALAEALGPPASASPVPPSARP